MAYEEGYHIYNHFYETVKLYNEDNSIFLKASQVIESLKGTIAYPFNTEALNDAVYEILGIKLYGIARCTRMFLAGDMSSNLDVFEDDYNETERKRAEIAAIPQAVRTRFLHELRAFCLTYKTMLDELLMGTLVNATETLDTIYIATDTDDYKSKIVRFVRADKKYFDILLSRESARMLSEAMAKIANGEA